MVQRFRIPGQTLCDTGQILENFQGRFLYTFLYTFLYMFKKFESETILTDFENDALKSSL